MWSLSGFYFYLELSLSYFSYSRSAIPNPQFSISPSLLVPFTDSARYFVLWQVFPRLPASLSLSLSVNQKSSIRNPKFFSTPHALYQRHHNVTLLFRNYLLTTRRVVLQSHPLSAQRYSLPNKNNE